MQNRAMDIWGLSLTHIGVPSDLFNDVLVEVAGVAKEAASNVVGVLQTLEDLDGDGLLRALAKLSPVGFL